MILILNSPAVLNAIWNGSAPAFAPVRLGHFYVRAPAAQLLQLHSLSDCAVRWVRVVCAAVLNALETLRGSVNVVKGFKAISALSAGTVEGASKCFDSAGAALAVPMAAMLHALARDGFVPLSTRSDPCAAIVRSTGVGGIVSITEHFTGAPEAAWSAGPPHAMIVVPSYQVTRLILCGDARVQAAEQQRPVPAANPRVDWWAACPGTAAEIGAAGAGVAVPPASVGLPPPPPLPQLPPLPPPGHVARLLRGPTVSSSHTTRPDCPAASTCAPTATEAGVPAPGTVARH